jgi:hypothetical protein
MRVDNDRKIKVSLEWWRAGTEGRA